MFRSSEKQNPFGLAPAAMRRPTVIVGSLLAAAILVRCGGTADVALRTAVVYEGATVIVGDGSDPIEDAAFVVDGGAFVAVGASGEVEAPEGASRVDLSGRTVIPALLDTHVHLSVEREARIEDLQRRAWYGVSMAVSLGHDEGDATFALRDEEIAGAARSMTAGRGITRHEPGRSEVPYWIDTEEEGRAAVRELAAQEVDLVKIWVDDRNGQYEKMTPELYGPVIEEAHQHGLRVTAHIYDLEDAKGLLRAGIDAFAHGVREMDVDDELMELVAERPNVWLVPNMGSRGAAVDLSWLSGTRTPEEIEALQAGYQDNPARDEPFGIEARNLKRLSDAGMKIAMGTDGNGAFRPHIEMADMVAAGVSPHDVLVSATGAAAEFLERDDLGTIAAGESADFVVLTANPLDDITNTRQIESVYLRGDRVDREGLSAGWTQ